MRARERGIPEDVLPLFPDLKPDPEPITAATGSLARERPEEASSRRKRAPRKTWAPAPTGLLQLKISLRHIRPPIWRRVIVRDAFTLRDLHHVIQAVMGWHNEHMHAFRTTRGGIRDIPGTSALSEVFSRKGGAILYEYDFGDGWEHDIRLEKTLPFDPERPEPACLAGARACPPENCGGYPGYHDILEALEAPSGPDAIELLELYGDWRDPEHFDLAAADRLLRR